MFVIKHKNIFFALTGAIFVLAIGATVLFGLKLGIDFTGGASVEFSCAECEKSALSHNLDQLGLGEYSLRETDGGFMLRTKALEGDDREGVLALVASHGGEVKNFSDVGPTIGNELARKALIAIVLVSLLIVLYIAFVFRPPVVKREVSREGFVTITRDNHGVSSWVFGTVAVITLVHDIIVPIGIFALLGHFMGAEVGVLFVTALLAILGYSVNDTIVVFDRVRERLKKNAEGNKNEDFETMVGESLSETYARSINTSLTTLLTLIALYFFGPEATHAFALTLIAGVIAGTYSSIFIAAPLLVWWKTRNV